MLDLSVLPESILSTQAPLIEWKLTPPWKFERKSVTRIPVQQRKVARDSFTMNIRDAFIKEATSMLRNKKGRLPKSVLTQIWVTHHVLPLCFGGTNDPENLALIPYSAHCALHQFVDMQIFKMNVGETRSVWIPFQEGSIWQKGLTLCGKGKREETPVRQRTNPKEIAPDIFWQANKIACNFAFAL